MHAYYRAMPSANAIVTEKIQERKKKQHKKKMKAIKCSVDNKPPKHWKTMPKRNLKKEMMMEERYNLIERENKLLLEKMAKIMSEETDLAPRALKKTGFSHKSLNIEHRQKEMLRISRQNVEILRRLQKSEPTYDAMKWELERKQQEKIVKAMAKVKPKKGSKSKSKKKKLRNVRSSEFLIRPSTTDSTFGRLSSSNGRSSSSSSLAIVQQRPQTALGEQ